LAAQDESERNRPIITAAFRAWRDHATPITETFASEMTWRIEGQSAASRSYASRDECIDEVLAPFARRFSTTDPSRPVKIRGVYADGDTVIVHWDGRPTATGQTSHVTPCRGKQARRSQRQRS
jgi:ketosteroid isomerase-like protein